MSLPKLACPKYPITIPSNKKNTFFRPFLMKEQKILMMAMESNDVEHISRAIAQIVKDCIDDIEHPEKMPMFDLEYLFLKIRSKSIGETIELTVKCPSCGKSQPTEVNLEEVKVERKKDISNKIMLSDKLGIVVRYPCLGDATVGLSEMDADGIIDFVCKSIDVVFDEDVSYTRKDFTIQEIKNFVESMTTSQFEKINEFYANLPELHKEVTHTCIACETEFKINFRGLQDFFT